MQLMLPPTGTPAPAWEQLSLGLANIVQYTNCYDNPGEVFLHHFEAGSNNSPVALAAAKGSLDEVAGPAKALIKVGWVRIQVPSLGSH